MNKYLTFNNFAILAGALVAYFYVIHFDVLLGQFLGMMVIVGIYRLVVYLAGIAQELVRKLK